MTTRRDVLKWMGGSPIAGRAAAISAAFQWEPQRSTEEIPNPPPPERLPGTEVFAATGDQAVRMVEGIRQYLGQETAASVQNRQQKWQVSFSSLRAYETSVAPNRQRLRKAIGILDGRIQSVRMVCEALSPEALPIASTDQYRVFSVRWSVLDGVNGEGLLLRPTSQPVANIVAIPDADWSPEMLAGLASGVPEIAQFGRILAEQNCCVLIPALLNRECTWSGNPRIQRMTNLTHREFIYRMSYELGRHPVGFEVQKVLAAVDWFAATDATIPVGVFGYGEGGLLALYSAACDTRIRVAGVSGYFQTRENVAEEPLYRNVWSLLEEFGDAELSWLVAPRALVVEASKGPDVSGPPPVADGRIGVAAPGRLISPPLSQVSAECERGQIVFRKLGIDDRLSLVKSGAGDGLPGSGPALEQFLRHCRISSGLREPKRPARDLRQDFDANTRLHRQLTELVELCQRFTIESEAARKEFWAKADTSSVESWQRSVAAYKRCLWEECIGKLPPPSLPLEAQSRKIYEEVGWTGYEVYLPLWADVFAYGILLLPRPMRPGERRPVVVCQHGLEGRPQDLIDPDRSGEHYYHRFAAELADHGFIVYCPQNPYIGGEAFRKIQRMANPLSLSLFSFILSQHERTLDWLAEQSFVDSRRIAFYGLSYGGKTAVRVPPLLEKYALSICAGDFNEWIWKCCRTDEPFTYVFTPEYDVLEFGLANRFNHSELACLMTPRPFMVERGHDDAVSVDSWVAYEYAKVRRHYDLLDLKDRTRIEYFKGPHTIHGVGTFEFLYKWLEWSEPFEW